MTRREIRYILASPIVQHKRARRRHRRERELDEVAAVDLSRVTAIIVEAAVKAVHEQCLDDPNPRVRQVSANAILDRAGIDKAVAHEPAQALITAERLDLLRLAIEESGQVRAPLSQASG